VPEILERSERLGFDEIWVSETFFGGGPISTASIALARTRLSVGFGVLSTAVRHPVALAMEIATLASLYPGRVRLGVGLGMASYLRRMGLKEKAEKAKLPTVVDNLRRLLAGESVRCGLPDNGIVEKVKLSHVPAQAPPIVLAGMGKQGLQQAALLGEGVLLSWLSCPAYIAWARQLVGEGTGQAPTPWIGANALFTLCADRMKARTQIRAVLARRLADIPAAMIAPLGLMKQIAEHRGNSNGIPVELVHEDWVDQLAVAGDEQDCHAAMKRLITAGLDTLILCPLPGEEVLSMLDGLSPKTLSSLRPVQVP
jgi:alkanesulfonate monooxygenase SsuD/methylene tetrahydromethanopterin reductase-like flavin-dependent oxidoreductase (luciferase family)